MARIPSSAESVTVNIHVVERLEPSVVVAVIVADPTFTALTKPLSETVATDVFELDHFIVLLVALFGLIVAVNWYVEPTSMSTDDLFNIISVARILSSAGSDTVTIHVADRLDPSVVVAVIVVVPFDNAVTTPFELTDAILLFKDFQLTTLFEAFKGVKDTYSVIEFPTFILADVLSNEICFTNISSSTTLSTTDTTHDADNPEPSKVLTVIVAFPIFSPLI